MSALSVLRMGRSTISSLSEIGRSAGRGRQTRKYIPIIAKSAAREKSALKRLRAILKHILQDFKDLERFQKDYVRLEYFKISYSTLNALKCCKIPHKLLKDLKGFK